MIENSQKWLAKYLGGKWAYRVVYIVYCILASIPIIGLGYIFDCLEFMIISSLVTNGIRNFTSGFHTTNGKCLILTYSILPVFGYISKTIHLEWSFLFALIAIRYIYQNAPLELAHKKKSKQWHRDVIQLLTIICLIVSLVLMKLDLELYSSCILWSLIMVAMMLFENSDLKKNKQEKLIL